MKIMGLIGGTSYESMAEYYRKINIRVHQKMGGHHSAKLVIVNLDFNEIVPAFYENRWDDIEKIMINAGHQLERAKVDYLAICCNTLHKVAPALKKAIPLPLLHILDATGNAIQKQKFIKIGLLGTRFTMTDSFHKNYLRDNFNIESIIPNKNEIELINTLIFDELCFGIVREESKQILINAVNSLEQQGAQGIILACTELFMLLSDNDVNIPLFDTTALHVNAIVECI